ncbi:Flp/Fap pilin component [Tepidanaerobacter acetatoxydans Re1]|uniref:Flp/Fap pilin component n=1 Tax=Tepidanaerobacter acetatoxydans (strain DSM 21804 / JCM 16047 / Re1) TaxID=1209989 RepID=F4LW36_TEPAE|nr:Flp family type IVb pilin [Tepidanaerobacter acetatoxydans]AEE90812.1 Flp/Fap pilin component [Tepidanaerobacter acetatoxydans Re1]CCP25369.1 Flp/Fap pilin component [Tepidanaerobacter acetatoxydans Re1]
MRNFLNWFTSEESGQGMVEYGLIIALVAVILIVALQGMTDGLESIFGEVTDALEESAGTP